MFNSIRTFSFLFGYLPFAAVKLKGFQKKKPQLSSKEYATLVQTEPRKWATGIMKRTKSEVNITGLDMLPDVPVLFVSNHEGNFDIPVILSSIPKPFGFISKKEVKKLPVIPIYMEDMNCVFIDRTNRKSALKSISDTTEKLKDGHSILIFPEGTRSKGEGLGDFKAGFFRIAIDAAVPIVPLAIHGTANIMEKNNNKIRAAKVNLQVLKPITTETLKSMSSKEAIQFVKNTIAQALNNIENKQ